MRIGLMALGMLTGCNWLFGLEQSVLIDAALFDPTGDGGPGGRPLIPPDGGTACAPTPNFETWTYAPRTLPHDKPIYTFGLFATGGKPHLMVTDGSGVWELEPTSGARQIPSLTAPSGKQIMGLATTPDGNAVWFQIVPTIYVAFRSTGFTRTVTELGLPNANEVNPAAAGYYDGTVRMIARVRDLIGDSATYVELSSPDGVTWTRGQTLPFGGAGYHTAAIAPDGCSVLFSRMEGGSMYVLYYAVRLADGTFGTPIKLTAASTAGGQYPINPALAPGSGSMWFSVAGSAALYEGRP